MKAELKSGYTTGVYACAALKGALSRYLDKMHYEYADITLPGGDSVRIEIGDFRVSPEMTVYLSQKGDNDDPDVTKGCKIIATVANRKNLFQTNPIPHAPYRFAYSKHSIYIHAGEGVGVATKKGLKVPVGYPAINPVPLGMMERVLEPYANKLESDLHILIGVENGEEIAKETANAKVGVLGGISILGTTGIVKPISNEALLDSIHAELDVCAAENFDTVVFTLGNSAHQEALEKYHSTQVIEIGNFIYDTFAMLKEMPFEKAHFIAGQGKMAKVAQGFKNTHNRYGETDFTQVARWLDEAGIPVDVSDCGTIKGVMDTLELPELKEKFRQVLNARAGRVLKGFLPNSARKMEITTEISKA